MAEGGKDEDPNNPFSFKSFISKKDKKKDERSNSSDADVVDIFDISENASQKRREKSRPSLLVEDGIFCLQVVAFENPSILTCSFDARTVHIQVHLIP